MAVLIILTESCLQSACDTENCKKNKSGKFSPTFLCQQPSSASSLTLLPQKSGDDFPSLLHLSLCCDFLTVSWPASCSSVLSAVFMITAILLLKQLLELLLAASCLYSFMLLAFIYDLNAFIF